jgi:hypothetical protein
MFLGFLGMGVSLLVLVGCIFTPNNHFEGFFGSGTNRAYWASRATFMENGGERKLVSRYKCDKSTAAPVGKG